jgi:hypothetical protein
MKRNQNRFGSTISSLNTSLLKLTFFKGVPGNQMLVFWKIILRNLDYISYFTDFCLLSLRLAFFNFLFLPFQVLTFLFRCYIATIYHLLDLEQMNNRVRHANLHLAKEFFLNIKMVTLLLVNIKPLNLKREEPKKL